MVDVADREAVDEAVEAPERTRKPNGELSTLSLLYTSSHPCAQRQPVTKLGRLVRDGKIKSIEEIYLFSLPVKEYQIIDILCPKLKGAFCLVCWSGSADDRA